jgi:hypothetical protein
MGEMVPWWKGLVAHDYNRHQVIVAPIPFNALFRTFYHLWLHVRIGQHDARHFYEEQLRIRKDGGV